jgi:hypothetical protein
MKVSFDFDKTLTRNDVQEFAKDLVNNGHEVWIVTSRFDDDNAMQSNWYWLKEQNQKLFDIAEKCGIKRENIHFTNMQSKSIFLNGKNFAFHLDDDDVELEDILENNKFNDDNCLPVHVCKPGWIKYCKDILII